MRGVTFLGNRKVGFAEFPDPTPGPGEVVVAMKASGMCGSDLHAFRHPNPVNAHRIAGHEPAGEVVALGAGVGNEIARIGARVVVHHYHGCGVCENCRPGWSQMCRMEPMQLYGGNADGGHAPYLKVPADTLVALDDALSWEAGATIGCGTGTAWSAMKRMNLTGADTIAIFGQGPVGQSATLLAAAQGARVIALDISGERLARASAFGATDVINPADGQAVEKIKALTNGKGANLVLETSGSSVAAAEALAAVRPWGTVSFVGIGAEVRFDVMSYLSRQITIQTSWSMSLIGMKECADFVIERKIDLDPLFTDRWSLEQAQAAYDDFDKQTRGKGVFLM